jgi:hypothetical protein
MMGELNFDLGSTEEELNSNNLSNSFPSDQSIGLGSFTLKNSPSPPMRIPINDILNFLSESIEKITFQSEKLEQLVELTKELLTKNPDVRVLRILKESGWTGTRYYNNDKPLELHFLLQSLSNYYLSVKQSKLSSALINFLGPDDNCRGLDKIVPFCPDTLLRYLRSNEFPPRVKLNEFINSNCSESRSEIPSTPDVPCFSFIGEHSSQNTIYHTFNFMLVKFSF